LQKDAELMEHKYSQKFIDEREEYQKKLLDQSQQFQQKLEQLKSEGNDLKAQKRDEIETLKSLLESQHAEEMKNLKQRFEMEKEQYQIMLIKKQDDAIKAAKRQLATEMNKTLDDQVNALVNHLQEQVMEEKKRLTQETNLMLQKLKSSNTQELQQSALEVTEWKEKYLIMSKQISKLEQDSKSKAARIIDLEEFITSIEQQNKQAQSVTLNNHNKQITKLQEELHNAQADKRNAEVAYKNEMLNLELKVKDLLAKCDRMQSEHEKNTSEQDASYKREIEKIMQASQQAVAKLEYELKQTQEQNAIMSRMLRQLQDESKNL